MKKLLLFYACFLLQMAAFANEEPELAKQQTYQFSLDLTQVKEDRIPVTLKVPAIKQKEIIYNLPKMVPGTYAIYDFGKFVTEFRAYDKKGRTLSVQQLDQNRWKIKNASALDQITYWVDDTFGNTKKADIVFEPAGTNIEENKNFLINPHGFIGYFDGMKRVPYEITITKPEQFYGSTPLKAVKSTPSTDTYRVESYMTVVDSPLMYSEPDTAMLKIGGADILISVYSPNKAVRATTIQQNIRETLEAQKNYLGGKLPVDKYAFLVYVDDVFNSSGAYGALEHSYSSVYYFPPLEPEQIANQIRSIAAHEFFHVVTPLSIHSEEIGDFDYIRPKMSKHLWLYEGVTEYFASHVQVNQKLITPEQYLTKLKGYIAFSKQYKDELPFTVMSKGALDDHAAQYGNVYQKGALIGMALDIRLRELSNGKYGVLNLMTDLAKTYGKDRSFKDEELFDKITALTYPEIRDFFRKYVEGPTPLPYTDIFNTVGITYAPKLTEQINTFGKVETAVNKDGRVLIAGTSNMNEFGKKMGYQQGDVIMAVNGQEATSVNMNQLISQYVTNGNVGDKLQVTVQRRDNNGKPITLKLEGNLMKVAVESTHVLRPDPQATEKQKQLLEAWLYSSL